MKKLSFAVLFCGVFSLAAAPPDVRLPNKDGSLRFAVLGDTGTGSPEQHEVGKLLTEYRSAFNFDFVLLLGDNIYGGEKPRDFEKKFEIPYKALLQAGVKFYATLGNHDDPNQRFYKLFNMNGERFYSFKPKDGVRFFSLDSNYMDRTQLEWLEKELKTSGSDWKICFFHHPLYSSGKRHGPDDELRRVVEPILIKGGVTAVFAGHEHFYERLKPQNGIYHFTMGASAKLREGNIRPNTKQTAAGFDADNSFILIEIDGDTMHFQAVSRTGKTVDSGALQRPNREGPASGQ